MLKSDFKYNIFSVMLITLIILASFKVKSASSTCYFQNEDEDRTRWECDDGSCIDEVHKCDGKIDCKDGTDEIAENCMAIECPEYAFRCAYGGCVAGKAKCNKVVDCADGSDENELLCSNDKDSISEILQGNCTEDFSMQCLTSKECIDRGLTCDGRLHCEDGSDEVVELCSATYCPSFAFRCGYGGCIKGSAKCNNVRDCPDGSDEAWELCNYPRKPGSYMSFTPPVIGKPSVTTTTTSSPLVPPSRDQGCDLPTSRTNMIITNLQRDSSISLGTTVAINTVVKFACETSYNLVGKTILLCDADGWSSDVPICTKFCSLSEIEEGVSSVATCYYKERQRKCNNHILPGTFAKIECSTGFLQPTGRFFPNQLECYSNAKWSYPKSSCEMECGKITSDDVTVYSIGGENVNITKVPWHVGVYSRFGESPHYKYECGGTIISPYLVLSAAHCFWDNAAKATFDPAFYAVVAGKYFREYSSSAEYFNPQKLNISDIIVHPSYLGAVSYFENDLAILRLSSHLRFTESISPICIHFQKHSYKHVESNIAGHFSGWGITVNQTLADELRRVNMKTLSHRQCSERIQASNVGYSLPGDKFCVINDYKETACRGDSGGGFVRERRINGKIVDYELLGVISNVPLKAQDCSRDTVVVMTNVQYFEEMISFQRNKDISIVSTFN